MTKPIKFLLNDWVLTPIGNGEFLLLGVTPDGVRWKTSKVLMASFPNEGTPVGWVETENSIYALGTPKK